MEFLGRRRDFMTLLGARLPGRRTWRAAVIAAPRWLAGMLILLVGGCGDAVAQVWPSKPIRAIVAFAAGSATDVVPRVVFEPLSAQLGQPRLRTAAAPERRSLQPWLLRQSLTATRC
jgi:hypothetical protein